MTLGILNKNIKYLILFLISIAVFIITIFLGRTASSFFAKAQACPAKNIRAEKVGPNSSSIIWETDEATLGRVEYGTNASSLTFTAPEAETTASHSVPLTLLTPNTIYYYLVAIGDVKCDSTGGKCEGDCTPYTFTSSSLTSDGQGSGNLSPTKVVPTQTKAALSVSPAPTSALSLFCRAVQTNIGKNSKVATEWATLKTYDIDGNGIINGLDIIKCQKSGK
ncbi:hypothetical protein A2W14_02745 [Candidatus Gottesmanbacteria bacterium RBG_16_37_8]|uniref:Purple acid phosphatase N-terminal domain-containing protein n=1 Tax=Candidatus Gottesmanbacteria bacterium RBG_16_37_8 TaxID=1798371 RepID=A0A1F5YQ72_9BACT|nr:MAG: hypothetical protein A2W14_02745 [Candidatus Gottesmanbacteria bacterium RBG_16_37_8]